MRLLSGVLNKTLLKGCKIEILEPLCVDQSKLPLNLLHLRADLGNGPALLIQKEGYEVGREVLEPHKLSAVLRELIKEPLQVAGLTLQPFQPENLTHYQLVCVFISEVLKDIAEFLLLKSQGLIDIISLIEGHEVVMILGR